MKIHFIAIGGALMHNLALALLKKGYEITGSDDEIYEPSRTRLQQAGLLPKEMGWNVEHLHTGLDAVIVGMHARANNPELLKAQELGLTIYSYPEYIYLQSAKKKRVVVGGSHGKTTTTSMIMHILKHNSIDFDYAVGAQVEGFDLMVGLSDAPVIIIEGDEYLASPIDTIPKFLHYHPHIAVVTGIAWDHINVFPTFKKYKKQFKKFIESIEPNGTLIYCKEDKQLQKIAMCCPGQAIAYCEPAHHIKKYQTFLDVDYNTELSKGKAIAIPLQVFGKHNLQNLQAARLVCRELGLSDAQIFEAIKSFSGAAKRLEVLAQKDRQMVFKDFAHAPSKVKATINAVKEQYPKRHLIAMLELHTFSSLNIEFLDEYMGSMDKADTAYIYYNNHTLKMKKLPPIETEDVETAFFHPNLTVFTDYKVLAQQLQKDLKRLDVNILMMSSGTWGGMDVVGMLEKS